MPAVGRFWALPVSGQTTGRVAQRHGCQDCAEGIAASSWPARIPRAGKNSVLAVKTAIIQILARPARVEGESLINRGDENE